MQKYLAFFPLTDTDSFHILPQYSATMTNFVIMLETKIQPTRRQLMPTTIVTLQLEIELELVLQADTSIAASMTSQLENVQFRE